jgi:hypothetical protein
MNKMTRAFAVGAMLACTAEPARSQIDSQAFCALFAHYFTNPPSAFIAERGDQISAQKWKSNRDHPNASCTMSLTKRATHIANADIMKVCPKPLLSLGTRPWSRMWESVFRSSLSAADIRKMPQLSN